MSSVKVRRGLARNDYNDPGWYKQPGNTAVYEWIGSPLATSSAPRLGTTDSGGNGAVHNVIKGNSYHDH